jgi:hypothetical protein
LKDKLIEVNYIVCLEEGIVGMDDEQQEGEDEMQGVQSGDERPLLQSFSSSVPPPMTPFTSVKPTFSGLPEVNGDKRSRPITTGSRFKVNKVVGRFLTKMKKAAAEKNKVRYTLIIST